MEKTIQVTVTQQDDGRYVAKSVQPKLRVIADTVEEAVGQLQEELTFALESSYLGNFAGNFRAQDMMVTLEVTVENTLTPEGDRS
jgi:predicted RNase H-like HicB family nuclease